MGHLCRAFYRYSSRINVTLSFIFQKLSTFLSLQFMVPTDQTLLTHTHSLCKVRCEWEDGQAQPPQTDIHTSYWGSITTYSRLQINGRATNLALVFIYILNYICFRTSRSLKRCLDRDTLCPPLLPLPLSQSMNSFTSWLFTAFYGTWPFNKQDPLTIKVPPTSELLSNPRLPHRREKNQKMLQRNKLLLLVAIYASALSE